MTVESYEIPKAQRELAERRTEFLIKRMIRFDTPLRTALESAYFQGMADLYEVINDRLSGHKRGVI